MGVRWGRGDNKQERGEHPGVGHGDTAAGWEAPGGGRRRAHGAAKGSEPRPLFHLILCHCSQWLGLVRVPEVEKVEGVARGLPVQESEDRRQRGGDLVQAGTEEPGQHRGGACSSVFSFSLSPPPSLSSSCQWPHTVPTLQPSVPEITIGASLVSFRILRI